MNTDTQDILYEMVPIGTHSPHLDMEVTRIVNAVSENESGTRSYYSYSVFALAPISVNPVSIEQRMYGNAGLDIPEFAFLLILFDDDTVIMGRYVGDHLNLWNAGPHPRVPVHSLRKFPLFDLIHKSLHCEQPCMNLIQWIDSQRQQHLDALFYLDELRELVTLQ